MEEKITLLMRNLKASFWGTFLSSVAIGGFLTCIIPNAIIEEPFSIKLQSVAVLVLLGAIPLALWLYNKKVTTAVLPVDENQKAALIQKWFIVRLMLIETALMFNIIGYAFTRVNSLLYCSCIALMIFLFMCKPNKSEINQLLKSKQEEE